MTANQNPEQQARDRIDAQLRAAGWAVQKKIDFSAGAGQAVREWHTDAGPADYVLFVDRKAVGVIEAKRPEEGQLLALPAYLGQLLSSYELRKQIEYKAKSTSGVNHINSGKSQALVVPLCGLTEQELILQELESKLSEADQFDQTLATALQQADTLASPPSKRLSTVD